MTWYIYKGEDLKRDQVIKFKFYRTIPQQYRAEDLIFHSEMCYAETNAAPMYPGPTVKMTCRVRSDLSAVNREALKPRTGVDGKEYFDVNYFLVLSTAEANLKFSLEFGGVEMGSVEATYV